MKALLLILIFSTRVMAQPADHKTTGKADTKELQPKFNTSGEQEEYNVKQMFKKEYKKQYHKKYAGKVKPVNNITFQFDSLTLIVRYAQAELKTIFGQGILYPSLFGNEDSLRITDLQELKYVSNGSACKRFSLWLFRKWLANPQVYYFELTNETAVTVTGLKEFIKGSRLTYFNPGGIIL